MEARLLIFSTLPPKKPHFASPRQENPRQLPLLRSAVSPNNSSSSSSNGGGSEEETGSPPAIPSIRYRARSRRQQAKQQRKKEEEAKPLKKKWEEMRVWEKAMEVYLGEKGVLFWLNKLAYASIFAVIGGWILFRFVGPSLGLYQLDAPPSLSHLHLQKWLISLIFSGEPKK